MDYRQSGVDIDAGNETVRRIKSLAKATFTPGVLSEIGSFGGLFQLDRTAYEAPVLVSSADGVGTKLKVAFMTGRHDTIGADLVNHCVNDILVQGARPLFFLDYLATGRLSPDVAEQVVPGSPARCRENGCALIGGETAEMPGFYADGEYDVAGFIVGVVERSRHCRRPADRAGRCVDRFALVRASHQRLLAGPTRVLRGLRLDAVRPSCRSSANRLATRCWPRIVRTCVPSFRCSTRGSSRAWRTSPVAASPRTCRACCRPGCAAQVDRGAWEVPPIFELLRSRGRISDDEMFRAFNMGIGLIVVCAAADRDRAMRPARAGRRIGRRGASAGSFPATATFATHREPPPRRPDLGTRIESSVDHRRDWRRRARRHDCRRRLEPFGRGRACCARARPASRRCALILATIPIGRRTTRRSSSSSRRGTSGWSAWRASCGWSAPRCSRRFPTRSSTSIRRCLPAFPGVDAQQQALDARRQGVWRDGPSRDRRAGQRTDRGAGGGAGARRRHARHAGRAHPDRRAQAVSRSDSNDAGWRMAG